jgi:hypothetical protein
MSHRACFRLATGWSSRLFTESSFPNSPDLEGKASLRLNSGPPLRPRQGMPRTLNSTVSTSPSVPPGKSPGALRTAVTSPFGKVAA